jgi:hypothetical protein
MLCDVSVLSIALPEFQAAIQFDDVDVVEDKYEEQVVQRTFATILPSTMPLPARSCTWILLSYFGSTSPVPFLGLMVTFPVPSAYMTNM